MFVSWRKSHEKTIVVPDNVDRCPKISVASSELDISHGFNPHSASRGPSATALFLSFSKYCFFKIKVGH